MPDPAEPTLNLLDTLEPGDLVPDEDNPQFPCLTILYHPHLERVGEQAIIGALMAGTTIEVSRQTPEFSHPGSALQDALRDRCISRKPIKLSLINNHIRIEPCERGPLQVNGKLVQRPLELHRNALYDGVLLTLCKRVVLLLHFVQLQERAPFPSIVGESEGIRQVRRQIAQVADLDVSVLIRGDTGVGKELVARCIHDASRRAQKPYHVINMATVQEGTATSVLFGHVKGAFTNAESRRIGIFEEANHGTLFLDEIGDTPARIQPMLLRVLSEGKIRPEGDNKMIPVDVRIIAATDVHIESNSENGSFRAALLHRLAGYEIRIPPLCERREDIPRLVVHFLAQALVETGESERLIADDSEHKLWFPLRIMMHFYRHDWPGNIRQLSNVVRQLVISNRGRAELQLGTNIRAILRQNSANRASNRRRRRRRSDDTDDGIGVSESGERTVSAHSKRYRRRSVEPETGRSAGASEGALEDSSDDSLEHSDDRTRRHSRSRIHPRRSHVVRDDIDDDDIREALLQCNWNVGQAAELLGMPRTTLYGHMDRHPAIRRARDVPREEIVEALRRACGDADRAARLLEVSPRALCLRLRMLDIDPDDYE